MMKGEPQIDRSLQGSLPGPMQDWLWLGSRHSSQVHDVISLHPARLLYYHPGLEKKRQKNS